MEATRSDDIRDRVREALSGAASGDASQRLQNAVEEIAAGFDAITCTLHAADGDSQLLHLRAQVGLPEKLLPLTRTIPFGKGMAGICAVRLEPVTMCNLQTDDSGVARPAARETRVAGALVVPLLRDGALVGTLGIGKREDHDYAGDEIELLVSCGEVLVTAL